MPKVRSYRFSHAFTLVEIVIVILILAILVAFGVPHYHRSLCKARARDAKNNLTLLHTANMYYKSRTGTNLSCAASCSASACTIAAVNSMGGADSLGLKTTGDVAYCCNGTKCFAYGTGFSAELDPALNVSSTNPQCTDTTTVKTCP